VVNENHSGVIMRLNAFCQMHANQFVQGIIEILRGVDPDDPNMTEVEETIVDRLRDSESMAIMDLDCIQRLISAFPGDRGINLFIIAFVSSARDYKQEDMTLSRIEELQAELELFSSFINYEVEFAMVADDAVKSAQAQLVQAPEKAKTEVGTELSSAAG
jgi:hypothetical protein